MRLQGCACPDCRRSLKRRVVTAWAIFFLAWSTLVFLASWELAR